MSDKKTEQDIIAEGINSLFEEQLPSSPAVHSKYYDDDDRTVLAIFVGWEGYK